MFTPPAQLSQPEPRFRFAREISPRAAYNDDQVVSPSPPESRRSPIVFYVDQENMDVEVENDQIDEDQENHRPRVVRFVDPAPKKIGMSSEEDEDWAREETNEEREWIDELFEDPIEDF